MRPSTECGVRPVTESVGRELLLNGAAVSRLANVYMMLLHSLIMQVGGVWGLDYWFHGHGLVIQRAGDLV